jgi:hypothetical protein
MKAKRLGTIGMVAAVLLILSGTPVWASSQLSNISVGRFQDFTVVTLFGDGPIQASHQIVEAKDGKPYRIVVDLVGVEHNLPQNNFKNMPEGSIKSIRTSQFAVSPVPVVRVVLDLAHPAAYRLQTPGNNVRVMVSLPSDPPIARVWTARDMGTFAAFEVAAESNPAQPTSESEVKAQPKSESEVKAVAKADSPEARSEDKPAAQSKTTATSKSTSPAKMIPAYAAADTPKTGESAKAAPKSAPAPPPKHEVAASGSAEDEFAKGMRTSPLAEGDPLPKVPLPMPRARSDRTIDYNLPVPASWAGAATATSPAKTLMPNAQTNPAKSPVPVRTEHKPGTAQLATQNPAKSAPLPLAADGPVLAAGEAMTDAADPASGAPLQSEGSRAVASLTTLPPLSEVTPELVPQRTKVVYNTSGRRDPFLGLVQMSGGYNAAALPDVGSLRLVGLLHDVHESWGLFEDANGFGYILRRGDRVQNGRLTKLTETRAYFSLSEFGWSRSVKLDLEPEG